MGCLGCDIKAQSPKHIDGNLVVLGQKRNKKQIAKLLQSSGDGGTWKGRFAYVPIQRGRNGIKVRRGKILRTHRLGIEPHRGPVLIRHPGLIRERTLYNVGSLITIDRVRMRQRQKIIAGRFRFRRRPLRSLATTWHAVLALSLVLAAFTVGEGRDRLVFGNEPSVAGGHDFGKYHLLSFRKIVILVGKVEVFLQESGQQNRIVESRSSLVVVPSPRAINFDVPLDRKAGQ